VIIGFVLPLTITTLVIGVVRGMRDRDKKPGTA
jgi:hypothetical protein